MIVEKIKRLFGVNGEGRQREQKRQSRERLDVRTSRQLQKAIAANRRVGRILDEIVVGARGRAPREKRRRVKCN